jgi:glycosyltransferase involved in cell wall biosynthesis
VAERLLRLLVVHSSADLYGSDKSLLDFVKHSADRFQMTVALPTNGPLVAELEQAGATVLVGEVCKIQREMFSPYGILKLLRSAFLALGFLGRVHTANRFDLVYSNTVAVLGGALAALRWGVPHVWHVREIMAKSRTLTWAFRAMVAALSTKVVCNSGETLAWIGPAGHAAKYRVVWNGFDVVDKTFDRQAFRASMGVVDGEVLFVLVGRINWWKGQKLLVQAFSLLDAPTRGKCRVAIVGSAPDGQAHYEAELAQCIAAFGCADRITVYPHRADIDPVWDAADVVVVPSTEPEPFGRVAIEAMGFGKPVIAAAHGGLIEIVVDGNTGLLVKPRDPAALANALQSLTNDASLRHELGQAGRVRQRELFSVNGYASQVSAALSATVARPNRAL